MIHASARGTPTHISRCCGAIEVRRELLIGGPTLLLEVFEHRNASRLEILHQREHFIKNLGDRIAAGVRDLGYEVMGRRTPDTGAGIVSFRKTGVSETEIVRRLRAKGIAAAARAGWVRTSPHFYVSPEEIERFLGELV